MLSPAFKKLFLENLHCLCILIYSLDASICLPMLTNNKILTLIFLGKEMNFILLCAAIFNK